jgi:branched-chain amino acid transport system substrate-binding protein
MKLLNLLAVAAGALAPLASLEAVAQQAPVKIGFVAELSGPQGALGQDMYDAFMLVVERNGGRLGGVPVQVLKADSQLKPEVGNQVVNELLEKEKVPIISGVSFSNIMMAIYKRVVDKEVFLIGSNASPSPIAGAQCNPFYFQAGTQNDQRAETIGRYAREKGYRRVYAMAPNYQAGKDFIAGFKREYKQPLLEEVYTALNQLDFQPELAQLSAAKPDAVYVFYPGGLGVQFVRQWSQSGLHGKIPLLSNSTVDGINLPALQEAAVGVIHGSPWGPDFDNAENKRFVQEFEARYKRVPSEYGATAYDSALLIESALRKVNGNVADKAAFRAALKAADFSSVRGKFKFNHNQLPIQDFYVFEVIKDGQGRYTYKTLAKAMADAQDSYNAECPIK